MSHDWKCAKTREMCKFEYQAINTRNLVSRLNCAKCMNMQISWFSNFWLFHDFWFNLIFTIFDLIRFSRFSLFHDFWFFNLISILIFQFSEFSIFEFKLFHDFWFSRNFIIFDLIRFSQFRSFWTQLTSVVFEEHSHQ